MAALITEGSRFVFKDARGERVLLNCADPLANKSRVSMLRKPGETHSIISEILTELIQKQRAENNDLALPFGVLDILLVAHLIRSAKPVKLLEYGSDRGKLSVHLAQLLGTFHEKSSLVCVCDTIESELMERISRVEKHPVISILSCGFGNSGLQKDSFDIVVLNGLADFPQPCDVLRDAVSLVKSDGTLFCYSYNTPLLESTFKLFFENREEYEISPSCTVMAAEASQCSWRDTDVSNLAVEAQKNLAKAAEISESGLYRHEDCVRMLELLQKEILAAVQQGEAELKIQLLAEKERLLNLLIRDSERSL